LKTGGYQEFQSDGTWRGRLVENAVGAHLLNHLSPLQYQITYWREGNQEVDFVLKSGKNLTALEVKSGRTGKISGLAAFGRKYPGCRSLVLGREGIPLDDFFSTPPEAWLAD